MEKCTVTVTPVENRHGVALAAVAELAQSYMQLRGTQNLLGIAKRNLRIAEENEELVNTRFANGIATTLDLAQARAQQPTIAATLPPLRSREAELRRVPKTVESSQVVLALRDYLAQRRRVRLASAMFHLHAA